jgi:hypothetical protein
MLRSKTFAPCSLTLNNPSAFKKLAACIATDRHKLNDENAFTHGLCSFID